MKGEWSPDAMVCGPTSRLVIEQECRMCHGSGVEPFRMRAACKPCGGTGKHYDVYHDGSMFAGRDLRGRTRVWNCEEHGWQPNYRVGERRCCDKRYLVLVLLVLTANTETGRNAMKPAFYHVICACHQLPKGVWCACAASACNCPGCAGARKARKAA